MISRRVLLLLMPLLVLAKSAEAGDCGPCEYKDDFGICWPKGDCVVEQLNPVTQVQKIVTVAVAVASGDSGKIKESLGDVLINSASCLGCKSVVHNVLPNLTDAQINSIVGEGFLVYVATGDPVLVTVDVATNVAREQKVKNETTQLPGPTQKKPAARASRTYTATAECMVRQKGDSKIFAVWKEPATFTDKAGMKHTYPNVDLLSGDTLKVTAPKCPTWEDTKNGQESLTSATFKFEAVSSLAGGPETLKWFAYGPTI